MDSNIKGFNPEYDDNRLEDELYFSREIKKENGDVYRKMQIITHQETDFLSEKNKDKDSTPISFLIKDNVLLYCTEKGQQKIHCWLMESEGEKKTTALHISRRTKKGVYGSQEVTLTPQSILILKNFLNKFEYLDTTNKEKFKLPLSALDIKDKKIIPQILSEKEFEDLIKLNIKNTDDFYRLLSVQKMRLGIERLEKIINGEYKNEVDIQKFLKENIWMFGNDYSFIIENEKINPENILDFIPQNFESYIDIIEVKLPKEKLFVFDNHHNNYYAAAELTKAIAQTQNYIFELEKMTTDKKYQQNNNCKIIRPKGIIIFGSINILNMKETEYLRILNSSYHNLYILTYQQLLEKANNTIRCINQD